ncbi:MAG: polysaccharide pyruvyl transferase family protein [Pseudomonadota bacterium]
MRLGILTFHRCINYGSYWQARCLADGLRERGHEVVILDHRSDRVNRAEWRCALRPAFPYSAEDRALYRRKIQHFLKAFAALPLSEPFALDQPRDLDLYDMVVVGSYEVWNLRHPWYGGCPLFYGEGLPPRFVSYAASFGNCAMAGGLGERWSKKLRRFEAISIRDENSRVLVREATEREPELVLDPCLQFPPAIGKPLTRIGPPYVAVYGHDFPQWFAEALRLWAEPRRLRLISIGYRNGWADEQYITAGPHEFAVFLANAEAVATNFFHGCVFALANRKPFACVVSDYRSTKVTDLTHNLAADEHLVTEETPAAGYERALAKKIAPEIIYRIEQLRTRSRAYLDTVLG